MHTRALENYINENKYSLKLDIGTFFVNGSLTKVNYLIIIHLIPKDSTFDYSMIYTLRVYLSLSRAIRKPVKSTQSPGMIGVIKSGGIPCNPAPGLQGLDNTTPEPSTLPRRKRARHPLQGNTGPGLRKPNNHHYPVHVQRAWDVLSSDPSAHRAPQVSGPWRNPRKKPTTPIKTAAPVYDRACLCPCP